MDDSFRVRVDKVFGSLTPSPSSSLRSLWSLSDEEVDKKEWIRPRVNPDRDDIPSSSSFHSFFSQQRNKVFKDLDDDDNDKEEWDIKSSIGLDSTLDNEEEEDEHDKVALGKENTGERLYMKDITDYGTYLNCHNILPESFKDHERDLRANYFAARIRLKEDEQVSATFDSFPDAGNKMPSVEDPSLTEDGGHLKSILKRKENQADIKTQKRVRFDSACNDTCEEELEGAQDYVMVNYTMDTNASEEDVYLFPKDIPGVPDYLQNPSKYTRYSFDLSGVVDETSNRQTCMDFLNMIKSSKTADSQLECPSADLPKSVTFIPKKKAATDASTGKDISNVKQSQDDAYKESIRRAVVPPGISASEVQENEACAMDEDVPETTTENKSVSSHKSGRQYRSKVRPDDSIC